MRKQTILAMLASMLLFGCQKELDTELPEQQIAYLQLRFQHVADDQPLSLGTPYENSFGEQYTVNKLKYYISNVVLTQGQNELLLPNTYFLVDESVPDSKTIRIPVAPGSYDNVAFTIGVDSARNVSGAQTGALDPINDMFWSWSTGYIMLKLEGSSQESAAPNNRLQYHIGGFAGPHSALRTLDVGFFEPLEIKKGQTLRLDIAADVQRWFDGAFDLPIRDNAVSMTPGELSSQYADNAAAMFAATGATVQ